MRVRSRVAQQGACRSQGGCVAGRHDQAGFAVAHHLDQPAGARAATTGRSQLMASHAARQKVS
ncbi:MAG: hypothetical protein U0Z44_05380 [Kouleothrix sp.]